MPPCPAPLPSPRPPLTILSSPLEEDYTVTDSVLGAGINGSVVACFSSQGRRCALKVEAVVTVVTVITVVTVAAVVTVVTVAAVVTVMTVMTVMTVAAVATVATVATVVTVVTKQLCTPKNSNFVNQIL